MLHWACVRRRMGVGGVDQAGINPTCPDWVPTCTSGKHKHNNTHKYKNKKGKHMGKQKYTQVQKNAKIWTQNTTPNAKETRKNTEKKKTQIKTHRQRAYNNYKQTTNKSKEACRLSQYLQVLFTAYILIWLGVCSSILGFFFLHTYSMVQMPLSYSLIRYMTNTIINCLSYHGQQDMI